MNYLKRVELWILFALIVAGLAWVFMASGGGDEEITGGATHAGTDAQKPLQLHRCVLKRDYGNARFDIDLRVRNDSAEKLVMQPPKVRLVTGKGREVPSYFLPFEPIPEVAPKATQDVQLRYWLETADLQDSLTLEVGGNSLAVKPAKPFDLTAMQNSEEKVIQPGTW